MHVTLYVCHGGTLNVVLASSSCHGVYQVARCDLTGNVSCSKDIEATQVVDKISADLE